MSDSDLVIGVLFASPTGTKVFNRHTQVGGSEVEQHLSGFVQQESTKTSLYLHHALYTDTQTIDNDCIDTNTDN